MKVFVVLVAAIGVHSCCSMQLHRAAESQSPGAVRRKSKGGSACENRSAAMNAVSVSRRKFRFHDFRLTIARDLP